MDRKLNCVMLVDDDEAVNYLHREILEEVGFANNIIVSDTASKALSLLEKPDREACEQPDVIFLDLNMPLMCGWDFVERLADKKIGDDSFPLIFILTTSMNVNNLKRAVGSNRITGFLPKPLTEEMLDEILSRHFASS
ncbi:MAG TPA: response regulator [Lunatimonas sp.]|nr:response regulator [Lunatimonas sp.]